MSLSKEQILSAQDIVVESVRTPAWGGEVKVKTMTGVERLAFEQAAFEAKDDDLGLMLLLIVFTAVDDNGERIFTVDDIPALRTKSIEPILACSEVAKRLNIITDADIGELAGKSEPNPNEDSTSG